MDLAPDRHTGEVAAPRGFDSECLENMFPPPPPPPTTGQMDRFRASEKCLSPIVCRGLQEALGPWPFRKAVTSENAVKSRPARGR